MTEHCIDIFSKRNSPCKLAARESFGYDSLFVVLPMALLVAITLKKIDIKWTTGDPLGRVWLVRTRTGFTRTARLVGTAPVLGRPEPRSRKIKSILRSLARTYSFCLLQAEHFHFFTVKPGTWWEHRFWSQMITCIRFWVGLVVPYTVTMVTRYPYTF